ncbi:uncharacterized protein LOC135845757 isoform X2 [Planococcus citri]|uniref:uncharacterized protein LOC135845757 isoform X2 n=1 Tax=Planococcus citri TaxID=170843 RepID=UPI0031F7D5D7
MLLGKIALLFFSYTRIAICNSNAVPKLPYDFHQLTSKSYYVDKSELLYTFFSEREDWMRCGVQFWYYISCPRGFGKTTNLQMIRNFAEIQVDFMGNRIPKQNTTAYSIFKNMKIAKIPRFIEAHLAEYPVIYLDFNFTPEDLVNETTCVDALFKKIQQCYQQYDWLKPSVRNLTLGTIMHKILHDQYDRNIVRRSIHDLSAILHEYFAKEVVLLIDDFDSAARMAMKTSRVDVKILYFLIHEVLDKAHHFTSFVHHAIITGVTGLNFKSIVYDHRIVERCAFLDDHRFSVHFGFDDHEVGVILDKYNCSEIERNNLTNYYKGYKVLGLDRRIYNPLSISQYFISKEQNVSENELLKGYWIVDEELDFILNFSTGQDSLFRRKIWGLVNWGAFRASWPIKEYPPRMLHRFIKLRDSHYQDIEEDDPKGFLAYFFERGFLSHAEGRNVFELPNMEIKREFMNRFQNDTFINTMPYEPDLVRKVRSVIESDESSALGSGDDYELYDDEEESEHREEERHLDVRITKKQYEEITRRRKKIARAFTTPWSRRG